MKWLLLLFLPILFCNACSKKDTGAPENTSEFHALLVFSPDSSQRIDVTGNKARMGCSYGGTYVEGLREDDAYVSLQVFFDDLSCITSAGTFTSRILCEYRPNLYVGNVYANDSTRTGNITFTTVNSKYLEGHFQTVCIISATDSVIITGTFKGVNL
jgi:hypothetical protein